MQVRISARLRALVAVIALISSAFVLVAWSTTKAHADTSPAAGTPATVSADPLPTVQQNGVVWAETTVGNNVWATGKFTSTWPAGQASSSTNQTARSNLLVFNITTGNLVTFATNGALNAQGLAVAASPNGSVVYVGGDFTQVNGVARNHIAAFNAATGALITTFHPSIDGEVESLAATNTTVYAGGNFTAVNGTARVRLAAFTATTGALTTWAPTADNMVTAMVVTPDGSEVVIGGRFNTVTNSPTSPTTSLNEQGLGAIGAFGAANSGTPLPYAINQNVRDYGTKCGITNLTTDGTYVYGGGFAYGCGNFEGTFAVQPDSGAIVWINDCHGDTYGTQPQGQVLYSVSHAHDCSAIGSFPDTTSPRYNHHALAETTYPTGTDTGPDTYGWNYNGLPDSTLLDWFPDFADGKVTGQNQATWSITGNSQYLALGGEFPTVNGVSQVGLVRFAVPSIAPDKSGPLGSAALTPKVLSYTSGTAQVSWQTTWDFDNANLTYTLKRVSSTGAVTTVYTTTAASNFWTLPVLNYTDTGLTPGATYSYYVVVTDPNNNSRASSKSAPVTISSSTAPSYAQDVAGDGASDYWRLDDASGTTGYDTVGPYNLTEGANVGHGAAGALLNDPDTASTFDGTTASQSATTTAITAPNTFSIGVWVNTTTTSGGKIIGFGNARAGSLSGDYDRQIYMDNAGHIIFGVYSGGTDVIASPNTYNDGQWHQIVATLSSAGMALYIDGQLIGTNTAATAGQTYSGFWRLGGDNLNGWPARPSSNNFAGTLDEAAIYSSALSLSQVQQQYTDSGRTLAATN